MQVYCYYYQQGYQCWLYVVVVIEYDCDVVGDYVYDYLWLVVVWVIEYEQYYQYQYDVGQYDCIGVQFGVGCFFYYLYY